MLYIATIVRPSSVHGFGCFCQEFQAKGKTVWAYEPRVDHILEEGQANPWEWEHAYRSPMSRHLILSRENSCWINFSDTPSLIVGPVLNGEPSLVAAWDLLYGDELTVGRETDADAELKLVKVP